MEILKEDAINFTFIEEEFTFYDNSPKEHNNIKDIILAEYQKFKWSVVIRELNHLRENPKSRTYQSPESLMRKRFFSYIAYLEFQFSSLSFCDDEITNIYNRLIDLANEKFYQDMKDYASGYSSQSKFKLISHSIPYRVQDSLKKDWILTLLQYFYDGYYQLSQLESYEINDYSSYNFVELFNLVITNQSPEIIGHFLLAYIYQCITYLFKVFDLKLSDYFTKFKYALLDETNLKRQVITTFKQNIRIQENIIDHFQKTYPNIEIVIRDKGYSFAYPRGHKRTSKYHFFPNTPSNREKNNNFPPTAFFWTHHKRIDQCTLHNLQLQRIPITFRDFPYLETIDLSSNHLNRDVSLRNLPSTCKKLFLTGNRFTDIPMEFPPNLLLLDLSNNPLSQEIHYDNLPLSLEKLWLTYCKLKQAPNFLPASLQELDLSHNKIVELPEYYGHLDNLKEIIIQNNQLTIYPEILHQNPSIEKIDLSHNEITFFPERVLILAKQLNIELRHNNLNIIPEFLYYDYTPNRLTCNLSSNRFYHIPRFPPSFENLHLHDNFFPLPIEDLYYQADQGGKYEDSDTVNLFKTYFSRKLCYYIAKIDNGKEMDDLDINNPYLFPYSPFLIDYLQINPLKNKYFELVSILNYPTFRGTFLHPKDFAVITKLQTYIQHTFYYDYAGLWERNPLNFAFSDKSTFNIYNGRVTHLLLLGGNFSSFPMCILELTALEELVLLDTNFPEFPLEMVKLINLKKITYDYIESELPQFQLLACRQIERRES